METALVTCWQQRHPEPLGIPALAVAGFPKASTVTTGLQDGYTLGCYLLPLLQPRAQRVCSSSKLNCLELETIRDTFSPCGCQHSVPLSPLSWQGRRQQWAHEPGRGMGTLVSGGMSPAAWQELISSGRAQCHLLPLQSPSAWPQSQGIQRRPYFQLNFSFIQEDRRLPYRIVSKSEFQWKRSERSLKLGLFVLNTGCSLGLVILAFG